MMEAYWYRVLKHFEQKGYFQNGLTIPYIIGSRTILEPNKPLQTIQQLFIDILNSNSYIQVLKCEWIGEYVFSLSDKATKDLYGGFENIAMIDNPFSDPKSLNDVVFQLEEKYTEILKSYLYSWIDGEWSSFSTDIDVPRLRKLL